MSPTVDRAVFEWKAFLSRWSTIIKKANRPTLSIELLSGKKIYFKGETEGQRAVRGYHADIYAIDSFAVVEFMEEMRMNGAAVPVENGQALAAVQEKKREEKE